MTRSNSRNARSSLIDDVRVKWPKSDLGVPILFTNAEIRTMLKLVGTKEKDVFYDLGCGWAQNLIVAATEFGVRKCVGIERVKQRYLKALERVEKRSLSNQVKIIRGDIEDLVEGKLRGAGIDEATIVLYALGTSSEFLESLSRKLRRGCRLVYYYNTLFPEIKADASDYPFYVSVFPFKKPVSELDWLTSIVQKSTSSLVPGTKPAAGELWEELFHDYDSLGWRREARKYQQRLRKSLSLMNA